MGSELLPLRRSGIYRNLPTFDSSISGLKAIVVGATGISGFNTIRSLLDLEDRWSTIFALSRRPFSEETLSLLTAQQRSRIQHVSIDLTESGNTIASRLKETGVNAEYVFFYGYMHPKGMSAMDVNSEEQMAKANVPVFDNFLKALPLANIKPKRILLQTGGKNYGMQIGRARTPFVESDPQPRHLSQNFYYPQEDLLKEYCDKNPECGWNVVRPFGIIGAVPTTGMSTFMPFAVLASVCAKKQEPVFFGGDISEWQYEFLHSSARLTGYLSEWAVLEEKCKDQAFNTHDGSPLSWDRFFEELVRWYGVEKGIKGPEPDQHKIQVTTLAGGDMCPLGYGPGPEIHLSSRIADWAEDESNARVWRTMMEESAGSLKVDVFDAGFSAEIADFAYYKMGQPSSAKMRRFGFNGFVDTMESVFEMYTEMAKLGVLPAPRVEAARPQI
jgi:nucleoside-diphosphate-sugar epimerase